MMELAICILISRVQRAGLLLGSVVADNT